MDILTFPAKQRGKTFFRFNHENPAFLAVPCRQFMRITPAPDCRIVDRFRLHAS